MSALEPRTIARLRTRVPSRQEPAGPVVVPFDSTRSSRQRLLWAASEAAARGDGLRLVRSVTAPTPFVTLWTPWAMGFLWPAPDGPDQVAFAWEAARTDLAAAVLQAHAVDHSLPVVAALRPGTVTAVVVPEVRRGALLVVGRRRGPRRVPGAQPSAAWRTVRRSRVPVAVVELADTSVRGPSTGRVVVALRGGGDPTPVLETAFRAALRRRTGVTLLHSWGRGVVIGEVVEEMLDPYRLVFPEVDVRVCPVRSLVRAVAAESPGAAATVVGIPRSRSDVAGSVALRRLVYSAQGPVVLVPGAQSPVRATADRPPQGDVSGPAGAGGGLRLPPGPDHLTHR